MVKVPLMRESIVSCGYFRLSWNLRMYRQNQPRPNMGHQQVWGGGDSSVLRGRGGGGGNSLQQGWVGDGVGQGWGVGGGGRRQDDVKVLSSSGYGVYGVQQQQRHAGGIMTQRPSMSGYQPRGMSGHYQGTVIIAGGTQSRSRVGNIVGTGVGRQNQSYLSGAQYHQQLTNQRQVIPQQQNSSSSNQEPSKNSYTLGVASTPPPTPATNQTTASKTAAPVNTFLSAFEKSFESFLNSKYNEEEEIATEPDHKTDPSSVENISSILHDYSSSNSPTIRSNPLHLSKGNPSPFTPTAIHGEKISKQQTIPKFNQSTKPKFNPVQEAKVPTIPRSLTLTTSAKHGSPKSNQKRPMSFSPQLSKPSIQQKSKVMITSSGSPYTVTSVQHSYQSPQARPTVSSNLSFIKVSSAVETIELEPEPETVVLDGPEEKSLSSEQNLPQVKSESDRSFQCNSCPKAFKSSNHLKDHEITHTGNYPFKCETCKKGFIREKQLSNHKCSNKEEKTKPFKCEECSKAYTSKQSLRDHKCASAVEDKHTKRVDDIQEEEILGEIVESIELEVPVFSKCSEIIFSDLTGVALISGDLIEYEDFECDLEEAVMDGWEVEVIGHDNMVWEDDCAEVKDHVTIPDGIDEIAKSTGLTTDEVRETLDFFSTPLLAWDGSFFTAAPALSTLCSASSFT